MKIENWNGHEIRFIEVNPGDWWAVLDDLAKALELGQTAPLKRRLPADVISNHMVESGNWMRKMLIVNEFGIYDTVFESRKKEAKEFKRWVYDIIKRLRHSSGLEGFEIFRMLDKDHQRKMMDKLSNYLIEPTKKDYIKANTIANKAVSTRFGYPKMLKKEEMTPEMMVDRQQILNDTVNLMTVVHNFDLDISVSEKIYSKYKH